MRSASSGGAGALHVADATLAAIVLLAPLAVGVVHPSTWTVAALLGLTALLAAVVASDTVRLPPLPFALLLALSGIGTLVMLIPLPAGLLGLLSPVQAEVYQVPPLDLDGSAPLHASPALGGLRLLRWFALAAFSCAVAARMRDARFRARAPIVLVAAGALAVLVTLVQTGLDERTILGLYEPREDVRERWLTPVINENHWGAFLGLLVPVAAGLVRADRGPVRLVGSASLALGLLVVALLGESRSGQLGLVVGALAFLVGRAWLGSRPRRLRRLAIAGVASALLAVPLVLLGLREGWKIDPVTGARLDLIHQEARATLIPQALRLTRDHPWTGVGPGGFLDAFPRYRQAASGPEMYRFVESAPVQALADHGVILGGALVLLILWMLLRLPGTVKRHPGRLGMAAGLVGLAVHELGDFAVNSGFVAFPAAAMWILTLSRERDPTVPRTRALGPIVVVAALTALVGAPLVRRADLDASVAAIQAQAEADDATLERLEVELVRTWPTSYLAAQEMLRIRAWRGDIRRALVFANRAVLLNPHHRDPHLFTARLLAGLGLDSQAWIEYRSALVADWRAGAPRIVLEVARRWDSVDAVRAVVPTGEVDGLPRVALILQEAGDPRAQPLAREVVEEHPDHPLTSILGARAHLEEGDLAGAARLARSGLESGGLTSNMRLRLVKVLFAAGEADEAVERLRKDLDAGLVEGRGWLVLGSWQVDRGDRNGALAALHRARIGQPPDIQALSLYHEARLAIEGGRDVEAARLLDRSLLLYDGNAAVLLLSAQVLVERGRPALALARARRALYLEPTSASAAALVQDLADRAGVDAQED